MNRDVQPELLDSLPHHHPDARHSRCDLRLINRITGDQRWIARTVERLRPSGDPILEVGAGTGELGRMLALRGIVADGLDLRPRPPGWPADGRWHETDALSFADYGSYAVIVGNLVFHHFTQAQLARIGEALHSHARLIVACEPVRCRRARWLMAALAPLFGANRVTRHDARVSIASGFYGREWAEALGLTTPHWRVSAQRTLLGTMRMTAVRLS